MNSFDTGEKQMAELNDLDGSLASVANLKPLVGWYACVDFELPYIAFCPSGYLL